MAQAAQAGEATGPLVVEDEAEGTQEAQSLATALSALTAEASDSLAEAEQPDSEEEMVDELSVKPDFSEDDSFQEDEK